MFDSNLILYQMHNMNFKFYPQNPEIKKNGDVVRTLIWIQPKALFRLL